MKDPANPTIDEVREWAYAPGSMDPLGQDWDLVLSNELSFSSVLLELAADPACPHQGYFLNCLYILIGDFVRAHSTDIEWKNTVQKLFANAAGISDHKIQKWMSRAKDLIENPKSFNYPDWCEGRLARS